MKYKYLLIASLLFVTNCATHLVNVIRQDKTEEAKAMLEKGANPNDLEGCDTPLYWAALRGNKELVELLLKKGADPKLRSKECSESVDLGGFRYNTQKGSKTALQDVRNVEIAGILIKAGADPSWGGFSDSGEGNPPINLTPLYNATISSLRKDQDTKLAEFLIKNGANVNIYDDRNGKNILLELISDSKKPDVVQLVALLTSKGAKNLEITEEKMKKASSKILDTYIHIPTGTVTKMSEQMAKLAFDTPQRVTPLTLNSSDNNYYHYSEFIWAETKQNLHEWLLLRKAALGKLDYQKK